MRLSTERIEDGPGQFGMAFDCGTRVFFSAGVCCLSGHVMWLVVGVYSHSFAGFSAFGDNVTCLSSRRREELWYGGGCVVCLIDNCHLLILLFLTITSYTLSTASTKAT